MLVLYVFAEKGATKINKDICFGSQNLELAKKSSMKSCPHCKRDNDETAGNCRECGAELGTPEKATAPQTQDIPKSNDESFSKRTKLLFWLGAWGGVVLATLAINPAYLRATAMFPIGLFAFLANGTQNAFWAWATGGFIIGWVIYVVLSAMMFNAKNKRGFIVIYVIFCILLALNVGGCQRVFEDASHIQ